MFIQFSQKRVGACGVRLITLRIAAADFAEAFTRPEDGVKVVFEMKGR
ncbi:MAG: hypothetical protein ABI903_03060 [Actinomycetota bacterium]